MEHISYVKYCSYRRFVIFFKLDFAWKMVAFSNKSIHLQHLLDTYLLPKVDLWTDFCLYKVRFSFYSEEYTMLSIRTANMIHTKIKAHIQQDTTRFKKWSIQNSSQRAFPRTSSLSTCPLYDILWNCHTRQHSPPKNIISEIRVQKTFLSK